MWDEGVAFYTGSLEGTAHGGNGAGKLLYRLAEKRCANFNTCEASGAGARGTSQVNTELFKLFATWRHLLQQGKCKAVRPLVNEIISQMTVPLVQGSLRYAYKNSNAARGASPKNAAEGATFSAAVLPLVYACSPEAATTISSNLKFGLFPDGNASDPDTSRYADAGAVKAAFEDVYACLGITCGMVGQLVDGGSASEYANIGNCPFQSALMAGYVPGSDVKAHSEIDLDQKAMEAALSANYNFAGATASYANGEGSFAVIHPGGSLKGFSMNASTELVDTNGTSYKHYKQFYDYYGDYDYADKWVSAALAGTNMTFSSGKHGPNNFAVLGDRARLEAVQKGTVYLNVWMYAIGEFENAIDDCETCYADVAALPPPAACVDTCTDAIPPPFA